MYILVFKDVLGAVAVKPQTVTQLYSALEPDEFARLLSSGRTEDLKILARKLSSPRRCGSEAAYTTGERPPSTLMAVPVM